MTENKQNHAKASRRVDNDFYRDIMEQARDIILVVSTDGKIIDANQAAVNAYGYSIDELQRLYVPNLRSPEACMEVDAQLKIAQRDGILFRTVHLRRNGEAFPVEVGSRRVRTSEGELVVSIVRNITATVAIETAFQEKEDRLQLVNQELTAAHEELLASEEELRQQLDELLTKEEAIRTQNIILKSLHDTARGLMHRHDTEDLLQRIVGGATELVGTPHGFVYHLDHKKNVFCRSHGLGIYEKDLGREIPIGQGIVGTVHQTGEPVIVNEYPIWRQGSPASPQFEEICSVLQIPLKSEGQVVGTIGLAYCEDDKAFGSNEIEVLSRFAELASIALDNAMLVETLKNELLERKVQERAIRRMAYHDSLTGLPNRAYLQERLAQELEKASRGETTGAVLFVDMDDLKMINDTLGHSYGDGVIIKAGAFLYAEAGENAVVSRIGGDEFMILLPGESERKKVALIADNMVKLLSRDYEISHSRTHMSASIGIALYPFDGNTVGDIFKTADLALYAAKGSGKNAWRFYESSFQTVAYENMVLKLGLREAIERQELYLQYQPIIDAESGRIFSFEALLRWTNPEHGAVPPLRFIPLAEESDTIQVIGKWVIQEACRFARRLADMGKDDIRVSVNVSPRQLVAEDFTAVVCGAIESAGINPNQLEIEITENALIASLRDSTHKLEQLCAIGIHISLDDFGTGYSSLTYLRDLPAGTLKIDKSFIDHIVGDESQMLFIRSIVNMAHVLRLAVVAEGVETEEQLKKLVECKCDFIQGYLFSRPVSEKEAVLLIDNFCARSVYNG